MPRHLNVRYMKKKANLFTGLFSFVCACTLSCSNEQRNSYASIIDYGLYDAAVLVEGNWKFGKPVSITSVHNLQHQETTVSIPCEDGRYWGMRVKLTNPHKNRSLPCIVRVSHPEFISPDGKKHSEDIEEFQLEPGETIEGPSIWYFLDSCSYEFVPGNWDISFVVDGDEVISKKFTIYQPEKI